MKSEKTWVENVSDISYNAEDIFDDEISYLEYSKKNRWETELSSSPFPFLSCHMDRSIELHETQLG